MAESFLCVVPRVSQLDSGCDPHVLGAAAERWGAAMVVARAILLRSGVAASGAAAAEG